MNEMRDFHRKSKDLGAAGRVGMHMCTNMCTQAPSGHAYVHVCMGRCMGSRHRLGMHMCTYACADPCAASRVGMHMCTYMCT